MLRTLSGGMKRRVMIAKALSHEPSILFLDEPTAGVDVELRQDMWEHVSILRDSGVTIILTTHYIEEAEQMADRIGIIRQGELLMIEHTDVMMRDLGKKNIVIELKTPLASLPNALKAYDVELKDQSLIYHDKDDAQHSIQGVLSVLTEEGIQINDIVTKQKRLEDIFVELVNHS